MNVLSIEGDTGRFIDRITTSDLGAAPSIFEAHGICILKDALSGDEVRTMRMALLGDIEKKKRAGLAFAGAAGIDKDDKNLRLIDLPNIDPCFVDLLRHPLVDALVRPCLGSDALLSAYNANVTRPGAEGMGWHTDQGYFPRTWAPELMALNIGWALDDVTEENGGTLVVPGSRDLAQGPSWDGDYKGVAIRASAGSAYIFDGRVYHRTGSNVTTDVERAVAFTYFCRGYLRTQVNWPTVLRKDVVDALGVSEKLLFALGYNPTNDARSWDSSGADRTRHSAD